ncbi:E3 ubiquitin-protein ligase SH3RF2 isoform X1 [Amia ocellicauda]|uniref:E3 ubiquitin-protein ligase SH3RF2 isoform X1 n=1 Tax=Amia ocellicauda TaxID=2972642 RepID=UPI003463B270
MEDLALLDLLECPLCFERLDVSAKVLPCQHTFCKPCLQRMVYSKPGLRCPECRTPISCGIEELPANVLLVRLLDGMRQGFQNGTKAGTSQRSLLSLARNQSLRRGRDSSSSQSSQRRLTLSRRSTLDGVPCARALYHYRGTSPGELTVKPGDLIILRQKVDDDWYHGEANGNSGLVPASFVQVIHPLAQTLHLRPPSDSEDKDENKNNLMSLKTNSAAVRLTGKVNSSPESRSNLGNSTATLVVCHRLGDSSPRSPRQTSVTSTLNRLNRQALNPSVERPSLEISTPAFTSSGNPAVVAQPSEHVSERSPAALAQMLSVPAERTVATEPSPAIAMALINPQSHAMSVENKYSRQQVSISVCATLYSYTPRRPEELELRKGEMVGVYGKYKEGWLRGLSLRTGKIGILPGNYVTPVLRTSARFFDPQLAPAAPAVSGKRPLSSAPPAAVLALDRAAPNGTTRPVSQVHSVAMAAPVMSAGAARAAAQQEGALGRGSVRRAFAAHRAAEYSHNHPEEQNIPALFRCVTSGQSLVYTSWPSLPSNGSVRQASSAVIRPQQPQPCGTTAQTHSISPAPVTAGVKQNQPTHSARPLCWVTEATAPSAGNTLTLDTRDTVAKEAPSKAPPGPPQSILVKPDSYKSIFEKPMKTVRFRTRDSPPPTVKSSSQPPAAQKSPTPRPGPSVQEPRGSQATVYQSRGAAGTDAKIVTLKKGSSLDISSPDFPPQGQKPSSSANRYRVAVPYTAQSDAELHLKEGDCVQVQKTRPEGRLLVTQEKSGKTGLFQSNILEFLEKQS